MAPVEYVYAPILHNKEITRLVGPSFYQYESKALETCKKSGLFAGIFPIQVVIRLLTDACKLDRL